MSAAKMKFRDDGVPRVNDRGEIYRHTVFCFEAPDDMIAHVYTRPRWYERLLDSVARAVRSMVMIQKFIK